MKTALLGLATLGLAGACNQPTTGQHNRIDFTPTQCGSLGCDFDDRIGVFGKVAVQISGIDGQPTAGLDLASRDQGVFTVARTADISNAPAWEITAIAPGLADLAALDGGDEVDFITIEVVDLVRLSMNPFVGDIVEVADPDYDQRFTVQADTQVSWLVRPLAPDETQPMGRFSFETVTFAGEPDVTDYELENSDRPNGHLSVNLPVDFYPVEFHLTDAFEEIYVSAMIEAVAAPP